MELLSTLSTTYPGLSIQAHPSLETLMKWSLGPKTSLYAAFKRQISQGQGFLWYDQAPSHCHPAVKYSLWLQECSILLPVHLLVCLSEDQTWLWIIKTPLNKSERSIALIKVLRQPVQSQYKGFMQSSDTQAPSNSWLHHPVLMVQDGNQNSSNHSCIPGSKKEEGKRRGKWYLSVYF